MSGFVPAGRGTGKGQMSISRKKRQKSQIAAEIVAVLLWTLSGVVRSGGRAVLERRDSETGQHRQVIFRFMPLSCSVARSVW